MSLRTHIGLKTQCHNVIIQIFSDAESTGVVCASTSERECVQVSVVSAVYRFMPTSLPRYLGMNNGILIILPYVVIYEDVLNVVVERVDPQRLPPADGVCVSSPPGGETKTPKYGRTKPNPQQWHLC